MNIDYAAIIAMANDRKDKLMGFEQAAQRLRAELMNSEPLQAALVEYKAAYDKLDPEAHKLLPPDAGHPVATWAGQMLSYWSYFGKRSDYCKLSPAQGLELLAGE